MKNVLAGIGVWAVTAASGITREITVAYTGVTANVLVACMIGTYCGFCWGDPVKPRSKMFALAVATTFMGAAITGITNTVIRHTTDVEMTDGLQAATGALISCLTRFFLTWLIDMVRTGKWLEYVPFLNRKKQNGE